jgi:hypothetical protein
LAAGDRYQARVVPLDPSVEELSAAGIDYPEYVTTRYLEVPQELRSRLEPLARRIASGAENPFEQASAVTAYLRREASTRSAFDRYRATDPLIWLLFH